MSAPTALDGGAFFGGLAWRVPDSADRDGAPPETWSADERRSLTQVALLTRTHDELCTQAVDPFEIAAGLEAAGINDRQARSTYGVASVFELADAMYRLVPRRPTNLGAPDDPWRRPVVRHLLRGLLYGLPGLLYAVALGSLLTDLGALLLLGATIVACGLGQGLSALGHVLIGRGELRAAASLFRVALAGGAVLLMLLIGLGFLSAPLMPAAILAGCQIEYILAATVLMVVDEDLLLLWVLAPGVLVAAAELTGLAAQVPRGAVLGVLALSLVGAVVAAGSRLTTKPPHGGGRLGELLGGVERTLGLGYVIYGAANAVLLSFAVIDVLAGRDRDAAGLIVLMMVPLVASLGVAEWLVYRLRSRAVNALEETISGAAFRRQVHGLLGRAALGYAGVLGFLTGVVAAWHTAEYGPSTLFVLGVCAYAVLGLAMLFQTMLLSLGRHALALGLAASALAVDTAGRWWLASDPAVALGWWHLAVFTGFLLLVMPVTAVIFGRAGVHR